jgi:hypothetical protein
MGVGCLVGSGLVVRPSREFAPAGDLLSCVDKKVGKETTPEKPPTRGAGGCSAMLENRGPRKTPFATLRSNSCAESVVEACFARASVFCASRRFQRGAPKQPNSQQPNATTERCGLFPHPPVESAEEHRSLRPCAKRTSWTDFAQLFDRSVAEGVLRGASRSEYRREPRCEAEGRAVRGRLFAYFLVAQKVGRPPGLSPDTRQSTADCLVPGEGLAACKRQGRRPGMGLACRATLN